MKMIYTGNGRSWPNIPARDLSDEEVKKIGRDKIMQTGLYEEEKAKTLRSKEDVSDVIDESTNRS